jgi:acetyltransferase-like isoleucine patch superfamily enzyme
VQIWSTFARLIHRPVARDPYSGWHDPARITMGRHSYGNPVVVAYDDHSTGHVDIGSFCSIASGVRFLIDGAHRTDFITSNPLHSLGLPAPDGHAASKGPVTVGHDVWIGRDATILSGVTISTGAVVGACAVVASDVRPYAVVVGNPAREIKLRFAESECAALLASKWWEWSDDHIRQSIDGLRSGDVLGFIERCTK